MRTTESAATPNTSHTHIPTSDPFTRDETVTFLNFDNLPAEIDAALNRDQPLVTLVLSDSRLTVQTIAGLEDKLGWEAISFACIPPGQPEITHVYRKVTIIHNNTITNNHA